MGLGSVSAVSAVDPVRESIPALKQECGLGKGGMTAAVWVAPHESELRRLEGAVGTSERKLRGDSKASRGTPCPSLSLPPHASVLLHACSVPAVR